MNRYGGAVVLNLLLNEKIISDTYRYMHIDNFKSNITNLQASTSMLLREEEHNAVF